MGRRALERTLDVDRGPTPVHHATLDLVPDVLTEALDQLEFGTVFAVPQDLRQRTFFHKRSDRDGIGQTRVAGAADRVGDRNYVAAERRTAMADYGRCGCDVFFADATELGSSWTAATPS
jgi:hypothetical protein